MSTQPNVLMLAPDGSVGYVPSANVPTAISNGGRIGVRMTAPDGTKGVIPFDQQDAAQKNGASWDTSPDNDAVKQYLSNTQPGSGWLNDAATRAAKVLTSSVFNIGHFAAQDANNTAYYTAATPPQDATEHVLAGVAGPGALGAYRMAKKVVDSVQSLAKSRGADFEQAKADIAKLGDERSIGDIRNALATTGDILGDVVGQNNQNVVPIRELAEGTRPGGDLVTPLTKTALNVAPLLLGADEAAPEEASTEAATDSPGIIQRVKNIIDPDAATQPGAQEALRSGADASAEDAGVTASSAPGQGIRTLMQGPIAEAAKVENAAYDAVNEAAGTDMKSLYDYRAQLQDAIEDPTNIGSRKNLTDELNTTNDSIADGESNVQQKLGEDAQGLIDKAKAATQQRFAMEALEDKLFNNNSVVSGNVAHGSPETIDVDSAIRQVENLDKASKFAPRGSLTRLQQALGPDGAKALKQGLYDAQRAGQTALSRQTLAKWLGGGIGLGTAGTIAKMLLGGKHGQ